LFRQYQTLLQGIKLAPQFSDIRQNLLKIPGFSLKNEVFFAKTLHFWVAKGARIFDFGHFSSFPAHFAPGISFFDTRWYKVVSCAKVRLSGEIISSLALAFLNYSRIKG